MKRIIALVALFSLVTGLLVTGCAPASDSTTTPAAGTNAPASTNK